MADPIGQLEVDLAAANLQIGGTLEVCVVGGTLEVDMAGGVVG